MGTTWSAAEGEAWGPAWCLKGSGACRGSSGPRRGRQGLATAGARGRVTCKGWTPPAPAPSVPESPLVSRREVSRKILAMSPLGRGQRQGGPASPHSGPRPPGSWPRLWGRDPWGSGVGGALVGKSRQKPSTWAGACVGLAGAQPPSISHRGPRAPGARARPWAFPEQLQIGKSEPTGTARPSRNGSALEGRKAKVKRRACTGLGMGAPAGLPRPSQGTSAALGPGGPGQGQPPHPARPPPQSCSSAPCLLGPARYSASFLPAGRLRQTLCLRVPSRYTGGFSGVVTELKMQA